MQGKTARERATAILAETLRTCNPATWLTAEDMRALRAVHKQYAGGPAGGEEEGYRCMVAHLLASSLTESLHNFGRWMPVASRITETLTADPSARARLDALWQQLLGDD